MIQTDKPGRAWLEISLKNLRWNYRRLSELISDGGSLMAVVKADAYGHGAIQTAKALCEEGCGAFAVAALEEGIALRNADIKGEILVLGYTMPRDAFLLERYNLIQTIVDEAHARALAATGCRVRGHLAVDTGMNRLGISHRNRQAILHVLTMQGITVEGVYSHMSVPDSPLEADRSYTLRQIEYFMNLKEMLEKHGYGKLAFHMQSSYGLLFYPMQGMRYARPGIALYGCASNHVEENLGLPLKPVLQMKSRIGCIRQVEAGEYVSYGRTYEAAGRRKIAVLAAGYADGLPRSLSGQGYALVSGKRAPIIGRICMDQTMLDITDIEGVSYGDIATLIGTEKNAEIKAVEMASLAGTITNELLSRLGGRLTKTYWE